MKTFTGVFIFVAVFVFSFAHLHAQTASFATAKALPETTSLESALDVTAMMEALASVDPVPFDALPRNKLNRVSSVGYWSMQFPKFPPLPGNPLNLDVWPLGDGHFVLDDRNVDYAALQAEAEAEAALSATATPMLQMMTSSLSSSYAYGNPVYLTNLVVTNAGLQPLTASFSIAGGTNFVPYDILTTTNLLNKFADWNWLGIGYTANRYSFSNQPANQAFYILAKPTRTMTVGFGNNVAGQCDVPFGLTNVVQVAGGGGQSLVLKTDGTVVAWGQNYYGQATVPTNLAGVAMVSAGWYHSVALLTNGSVMAWGLNAAGLYNLTTVPSNLTNATAISAQALHTLALRKDGTVIAWGYNNSGETSVPAGLSNVATISAGYQFSLAVTTNGGGTVVAWGDNSFGQRNVPAGLSNVVDVAAGTYHSLALLNNGTVVAWGDNDDGETNVPVGLSNVVAIAASGDPFYPVFDTAYSLALKSDGTVVAWGDDEAADPVGGLNNVIAIAAGADHALAIRTGPTTPVITVEPIDEFQVSGSNVTFTARGAGLYGVSYQWQTNSVNLPGATNAALVLTNVQPPAQLASYRVMVGNEAGSLASSNVGLYFVTPPVITSQTLPTNQTVIYQSNLVLNVVAVAPGMTNGFPLAYQWQFNGTNIGANAASYTIHTGANSFGTYSVLVSNAAGSTNAAWQVTVYSPYLLITQRPTNQYQIAGSTVTFAGSGVSSNAVTYQWAFNGTNISGATNAVLTLTNVLAAQQGYYNFIISDGIGSLTSSNANFYLVTLPIITSQTTPTNRVCIYGNYVSFAATATAPYQTNGFPLSYRWQWNGTNIAGATATNFSFTVNDTNGGVYSLIVSNAAGSTNISWQVTLTNAINVTNDLLLIYNTNSADSMIVKDYYLAHRPMVGGANVLGISYTNATSPGYYECISPTDLTNLILNPVATWLTNNPTKRPQYVILFLDVPSRVFTDTTFPINGNYPRATPMPSVSVQLRSVAAGWQPFVTHINMNGTNDCIAHINKVATFGTNYSPGKLIVSASAGGYGNTNYALDNVRHGTGYIGSENYSGAGSFISAVTNGLLTTGVLPTAIIYTDGLDTITNGVHFNFPHLTNALNIAGYMSWGQHSSLGSQYPLDGTTKWAGDSSWWIIETIESFNGLRFYDGQGNFVKWFSPSAFGGTNYSNTPIGAVSNTDEPNLKGMNNAPIYFGLWAAGKNFAICAWDSRVTSVFQAVGDPFVSR